MFKFNGKLDVSKSWMNRALIIQSFDSQTITIDGESNSQDVILLKQALIDLANGKTELYAGLGGTTFRFLALRASREVGSFFIRADDRLLARPQTELINIFKQLGVDAVLNNEGLKIESVGWREPKESLTISTRESSQFLSAVLLNSIHLNFDLLIQIEDEIISADYFKYTLKLLFDCGVSAIQFENSIFIKKNTTVRPTKLIGELDVSSAFSLVAAGVLAGDVEITNWNSSSTQPDIQFLEFFKQMGISFEQSGNTFKIQQQSFFKGLSASLENCPDLFPVLAVLCAFAESDSHLYGAPQLKFKESDRIAKTVELLSKSGYRVTAIDGGIKVSVTAEMPVSFSFDPEHDHRMAMAAALLKLKQLPVKILNPTVINKSYPQFYQHIGLNL